VGTLRWPAVIFYLDGTLVDTVELIVRSYRYALTTVLGGDWPDRTITPFIGRSLPETMRELNPDRAADLLAAYSSWNAANSDLIRRFEGADEVLRELRTAGARVAIATSKRAETTAEAMQRCGLAGLVEVIVTHPDTSEHKPRPAPLLLAADRLGVAADQAVYVGDAVVDVMAAKAAGMSSVAVLWGAGTTDTLRAAEPDAVVGDLAELRTLLVPEG
jgi:pyrophosphatase PpaX